MRRSAILLVLAACGHHAGQPDRGAFDAVYELDVPPGVSDLTLDDRGALWAICERDRVVLEIPSLGAPATRHPLDGVADALDTESIAWLAPGRFAIGTEGQDEASASVLTAALGGDGHLAVTGAHELTTAEVGVPLKINHGAEGMCGRGDDLLVAIETVGKLADGTRYAPIVHVHAGAVVGTAKLRLTSDVGKISALFCTQVAPGAEVLAIERHYHVSRILRFHFGDGELAAEVVKDLDPILHNSRNIEGIVRLPDGRLALVNDNQGSSVDGPTELFVLPFGLPH